MLLDGNQITSSMLPRIGATMCGAALLCPGLALPLVIVCLAALGAGAAKEARAENIVPELPPPVRPPRRRRRAPAEEAGSTEDSFPASDPPSWTPVTGTGTRH